MTVCDYCGREDLDLKTKRFEALKLLLCNVCRGLADLKEERRSPAEENKRHGGPLRQGHGPPGA
jgi:hypothetical protein